VGCLSVVDRRGEREDGGVEGRGGRGSSWSYCGVCGAVARCRGEGKDGVEEVSPGSSLPTISGRYK